MIKGFLTWLGNKISPDRERVDASLHRTGRRISRVPTGPKPRPQALQKTKSKAAKPVKFAPELGGSVQDGGPGKNVLVRNKYVREDTGTHETLKIIEDPVASSIEEDGIDPYNTGRFDRSKFWEHTRTRK